MNWGPPGFAEGVERGQFFHGLWTWFVLGVSILGRRENHDDSPTGGHLLFWFITLLLDVLFIIACYGYGIVQQDDAQQAQTLMGMGVTVGGLLLVQVVYVSYIFLQPKIVRREDYLVLEEAEDVEKSEKVESSILAVRNWLMTHHRAGKLSNVPPPWNYVLRVIRFMIVVWTGWLIALFFYIIIAVRIMQPCGTQWETGERETFCHPLIENN